MIEEHFCIENLFISVISDSWSPVVLEVQAPMSVFTLRLVFRSLLLAELEVDSYSHIPTEKREHT